MLNFILTDPHSTPGDGGLRPDRGGGLRPALLPALALAILQPPALPQGAPLDPASRPGKDSQIQ